MHTQRPASSMTRFFQPMSLMLWALIGTNCFAQQQPAVVQTFELREWFGVSHPDQIIDFDLKKPVDPNQCAMLGPDGNEVPYQLLSNNRVAVRTDLPADAVKQWTLILRKPASAIADPAAVVVSQKSDVIEITNDRAGVRIPNITAAVQGVDNIPAPIQAIRYQDGSWVGGSMAGAPVMLRGNPVVTTMKVTFLERGPLVTQALVEYAFNRPERKTEAMTIPAGVGYYRSTIRVEAAQPSIMILEDTDTDFCYRLNLYPGLTPDQGRYRGHNASDAKYGHTPDGLAYPAVHTRKNYDASVDVDCTKYKSSELVAGEDMFPRVSFWNPWASNTGWYWMVFNRAAPPTGNLLGIYHGRPSLTLGPGDSGVGFYTGVKPAPKSNAAAPTDAPPSTAGPAFGLTINFDRRDRSARTSPRVRFEWALFVGSKGQDLKPYDQVQTIGLQQNLHAGISLNKLHRYTMDYPDSKVNFAGMFADPSVFEKLVTRLRAEPPKPGVANFGSRVAAEDELSRPWLELWADTTGVKSKEAADRVLAASKTLLDAYVNGSGVYDLPGQYWKGGSVMNSSALTTAYLLGGNDLQPQRRAQLKAAMVMFGAVLWDLDFVPLFEGHYLNQGNANMPPMQYGYQDSLALILSEHPRFAEHARNVGKRTIHTQDDLLRDNGVLSSSPHYASASMDGTLSMLLRVKRLGGPDPFATEPKLARFAEFYMNFLTPPEPRFGGVRKIVAVGDGCYESSIIYGKLATGLRDSAPTLSARLMGAWNSMGKPHSGVFGLPTRMQIDEEAPSADPALRSGDYPGYYSVLRHGWGTSDESALWLINGENYRDHRHADHGSFLLYALGVPVSLDWGSMYAPRAAGSFAHSMAVPEARLKDAANKPIAWNQDAPPLDSPDALWIESRSEGFAGLDLSGSASGRYDLFRPAPIVSTSPPMTWHRQIQSINIELSRPIYIIRDRFEAKPGVASDQRVVVSTNLVAKGPVTLPSGETFTPTPRMHPSVADKIVNDQLPSAGPVMSLAAGTNRFGFTGQFGVDWDVAVIADNPTEALLGAWGHQSHPTPERNQYLKTMNAPFEERQYVLRVRGTGALCQVILPYRQGQRPSTLSVTNDGDAVKVVADDETLLIKPSLWTATSTRRRALGTFDGSPVTLDGVTLSGAPMEAILTADGFRGTAQGEAGKAMIQVGAKYVGRTLTIVGRDPVKLSQSPISIPTDGRRVEFEVR